jgi:hypothetical protein
MPHITPRPSLRKIWVTLIGVMLAHWAVLQAAPQSAVVTMATQTQTEPLFTTRSIAADPIAPKSLAPAVSKPKNTSPEAKLSSKNKAKSPAVQSEQARSATEMIAASPKPQEPSEQDATLEMAPVQLAQAPQTNIEPPVAIAPKPAAAPTPAKLSAQRFIYPPSVRLKYDINGEVKNFPYSASSELLWVHDGTSYDARMEIRVILLGTKVQTSTGQLTSQGLEPTRFGDKFRSELAAHFERAKGKVIFSANTPDVALQPGAQDQLSVFMQLASLFGGAPKSFPKGTHIAFQTIGARSAETWDFVVDTTEKLKLPGGEVNAIKLVREPQGDYEARAEIWLAPDMGYLPVRIRLTQGNADFVDQQWRSKEKP